MARIDLHLHSTYSDGSFSPTDLIHQARHARVTALALTDHDTTAGMTEALEAAKPYSIEVISGVEISSLYKGKETHILGYFVDYHNESFQKHLYALRKSRQERIPKIIARLNNQGLSLSHEDVTAVAGHGSIGRPHIAQVLVNKQYASTIEDAFSRYLKEGAAAYITRELPDAKEAIHWIRNTGGIPSLAHPSWVGNSMSELQAACKELKTVGLQGIEVFYGTHTLRQTSDYLNLARRLELLPTGGSDFHGATRPHIAVGVGKGNLNVPEKILEPLKVRAAENRKTLKCKIQSAK